jgi:hypothetical protein
MNTSNNNRKVTIPLRGEIAIRSQIKSNAHLFLILGLVQNSVSRHIPTHSLHFEVSPFFFNLMSSLSLPLLPSSQRPFVPLESWAQHQGSLWPVQTGGTQFPLGIDLTEYPDNYQIHAGFSPPFQFSNNL